MGATALPLFDVVPATRRLAHRMRAGGLLGTARVELPLPGSMERCHAPACCHGDERFAHEAFSAFASVTVLGRLRFDCARHQPHDGNAERGEAPYVSHEEHLS